MKFLVDAQLPPALARFLVSSGHVAGHVMEAGLTEAEDDPIWSYAEANACVIVTKDEDFASRRTLVAEGPAIVWLRIGNCSNRALLRWLTPMLDDVVERLAAGEKLIEIV